jgi:hypothetical protein
MTTTSLSCPCGATLKTDAADVVLLDRFYEHHAGCLERMSRPPAFIAVDSNMTMEQIDHMQRVVRNLFATPAAVPTSGTKREPGA